MHLLVHIWGTLSVRSPFLPCLARTDGRTDGRSIFAFVLMNIHLSREIVGRRRRRRHESEKRTEARPEKGLTEPQRKEQTDTIDPLSSRDPFQFEMHFSQ